MADSSVKYLGLNLKNPVILSSSGLGSTSEGVKKAMEAGVGAVVLKSLFEEQLAAEAAAIAGTPGLDAHPEMDAFLSQLGDGAGEYLELIRKAKSLARVPVIASLNCADEGRWTDFAEQIQAAGADALELNMGVIPLTISEKSADIEARIVRTVKAVADKTNLPLAVKLGTGFTNLPGMVARLAAAGARSVVLFNRFYRLDLDLASMSVKAGPARSSRDEYHEALRWTALLYGAIPGPDSAPLEIAAGTGIHDGETALKLIAAGAQVVQLCSVVYQGGYPAISRIVKEMDERMDALKLASVADLRGKLSQRAGAKGESFSRLQYVSALNR
jgi:dihydroorotate dehydrogenase (fumarate)